MYLNDILLGLFLAFGAIALAISLIGYMRTREKRLLKLSTAFALMVLKGGLMAQQYFTGIGTENWIMTAIDLLIVIAMFALFW